MNMQMNDNSKRRLMQRGGKNVMQPKAMLSPLRRHHTRPEEQVKQMILMKLKSAMNKET